MKKISIWFPVAVVALFLLLLLEVSITPRTDLCKPENKGPFDGHILYTCTVNAVAETHKDLASPEVRKRWLSQWQHKYDGTYELDTEEGTLKAITAMLVSLKARWDFVYTPEQSAENALLQKAQLAGIGAAVAMESGVEKSKSGMELHLPEHMTPQLHALLKDKIAPEPRIDADNPLAISADPERGTPAHDAGLKRGDRIVAVNNQEVIGKTASEVVAQIRGRPGSEVLVTVLRDGERRQFRLVRNIVTLHATEARAIDEIGYLKIAHFESLQGVVDTHDSLELLCQTESREGDDSTVDCKAQGLIIDLRNNPGGRMDVVLVVSELLVDRGELARVMQRSGDKMVASKVLLTEEEIVSESPSGSNKTKRDFPLHFPSQRRLVVLINENSASGAEMLAKILQQQSGAVVVGMQSRGKGVGQCPVSLPFGYTAHIICLEYMAGGKPVDWEGVLPNVVVEQPAAAERDLQLDKAVAIVRGEPVVRDPDTEAALQSKEARQQAYEREVADTIKRFLQ